MLGVDAGTAQEQESLYPCLISLMDYTVMGDVGAL